MTSQEKELLERFLAELTAARPGPKDAQAEALIRDAAARQPDAVYLLVQRAIQLDQALQMTQAEMQKLQGELERARAEGGASGGGGGFLSDPYAWGSQPRPAAAPSGAAQTSVSGQPLRSPAALQPQAAAGASQPMAPAQPQPVAAAARPGWGGSGMLGTVAGTAAGVVGGAFLFQGIQNLMHHNDPAAATPPPATPHPLASDSPTQEPFLLNDPSLADDSSGDNDSFASSDDAGGDDSSDA